MEVAKDRAVQQARSVLLPPEVPLRTWLEARVGGEVEVIKEPKGIVLRLRSGDASMAGAGDNITGSAGAGTGAGAGAGAGDAAAGNSNGSPELAKDRFFATLPEDSFLNEEEGLREALLNFLGNWKQREPPRLSQAVIDHEVSRMKLLVIPKGIPVSLKDWIDRRMGAELEMLQDERGQLVFGERDKLQAQMSAVARKRPREEETPAPTRGGGGGAGEARGGMGKGGGGGGGPSKGPGKGGGGDGRPSGKDGGGKGGGGGKSWKKGRSDDDDRGGKGSRPSSGRR